MNASTSHENRPVDINHARAMSRLGMKLRGGYELVEVAGLGGLNTFYLAYDSQKNIFGVKIPHDSQDHRAITALNREFEVSRRVKHRNIVEIHKRGQTDSGEQFLVMDYVAGQSLEERRLQQGGRLSVSEVLACGIQVATMLESVHAAKIVHLDLNLGNVLLANGNGDDSAYLIDFGTAKISATDDAPAFDDPRAKQHNQFSGNLGCAAPEQFGSYAQIDERSDVFSLAAMMHMAVTGQFPNGIQSGRMNLLEWVARRCINQTAPIATLAPIPHAVAEVIDTALCLDPKQRFASAALMREALERARLGANS